MALKPVVVMAVVFWYLCLSLTGVDHSKVAFQHPIFMTLLEAVTLTLDLFFHILK